MVLRRLARPDQRLQQCLQILHIGRRPLVQDHQIDRKLLHPPVFVGAEQLPHDSHIVGLVDPDQGDRNVTRNPVGPRGGGPARVARQHVRGGPQRPVRVGNAAGGALKEVGLIGPDAEMAELNLAWVHASVAARSKVAGSRYLSARSTTSSRDGATSVEKVTRTLVPGGSRTRRRRLTIGSSTAPTVLESDRPSITEVGVRIPRPRPRNRPRSVSHCKPPTVSPSTTTTWASQIVGSLRARGRRVARRASSSGAHSVCTNRLENAGWAASADGDASTTSAYDVSSISRVRVPRFVSETRRTSASSSGDTITSRVAVIARSRRVISARSSENAT